MFRERILVFYCLQSNLTHRLLALARTWLLLGNPWLKTGWQNVLLWNGPVFVRRPPGFTQKCRRRPHADEATHRTAGGVTSVFHPHIHTTSYLLTVVQTCMTRPRQLPKFVLYFIEYKRLRSLSATLGPEFK
jgi:hypothetical protein